MKNVLILSLACLLTQTVLFAQSGKVGINITTPSALLHVKDGSVVFTGIHPPPGTENVPVSGVGTRMMWFPDKAAFRAGSLTVPHGTNWNTDSIGFYSVAFGLNTFAKGSSSTASGVSTKAFGNYSTALGAVTLASGDYSTAMGNSTEASGFASTSMGQVTTASGAFSTAIGYHTEANPYASVVLGGYNNTNSISSTAWEPLDPVFIIGNGTSDIARNNAVTVLKNGKVGINSPTPLFGLHVVSNDPGDGGWVQGVVIDNTASTGEAAVSFRNDVVSAGKLWIVGLNQNPNLAINYGASFAGGTTKMVIDTLGNVGIGTTAPTERLHVVGDICYTGSIAACSDIRYKKKILPISNALIGLQLIQGIYYNWDQEKFSDKAFDDERQIGYSAQELEVVFPEMVHTDINGYKSVDYSRMTPVLVEAVKEQQKIISSQQIKLDSQSEKLDSQQVKLESLEKEMEELRSLIVNRLH